MAEDADWGPETWRFEPEGLQRLVTTLKWVCGRILEPFSFQPVWVGDPAEDAQSRDPELLEIVAADAIGAARHMPDRAIGTDGVSPHEWSARRSRLVGLP
jgi:hypothetical protein